MKRFWLSWYEPSEDWRPVHFPPNENILGCWCSELSDIGPTVVAFVESKNEQEAWDSIDKEFPREGPRDIRFCEERDFSFLPNDRFPLDPWMENRIIRKDMKLCK
jgi:hypothetical protein